MCCTMHIFGPIALNMRWLAYLIVHKNVHKIVHFVRLLSKMFRVMQNNVNPHAESSSG